MSLRLRVTLFLALAVAVAVAAVSWAAYASAEGEARSEIDEALLSRVAPDGMAGGQGIIVSSGTLPAFPQPFPGGGVELRPDLIMQFVDASGAVFAPFTGGVALPVEEEDLAIAAGSGETLLRDVQVEGVHYRMVTAPAMGVITVTAGQGRRGHPGGPADGP